MEEGRFRDIILIFTSLFIGILLDIVPLPGWGAWVRPQFVFLILLFWLAERPAFVGIGLAFFVGIFTDVMEGTLLGEHALVFSLIAYLILKFHPHMRNFPIWQQSIMVLLLTLLNLALRYWIMGIIGTPPHTSIYWLAAVSSMVAWPWLSMILSGYSRRKPLID